MGENEAKGTIQYYDTNLGEWRELSKTTEIPELVMSTECEEDFKYTLPINSHASFTGTVEMSDVVKYMILEWRAYDKLVRALFSGDRRKIKRAKRNFKKAKERYLKEI